MSSRIGLGCEPVRGRFGAETGWEVLSKPRRAVESEAKSQRSNGSRRLRHSVGGRTGPIPPYAPQGESGARDATEPFRRERAYTPAVLVIGAGMLTFLAVDSGRLVSNESLSILVVGLLLVVGGGLGMWWVYRKEPILEDRPG